MLPPDYNPQPELKLLHLICLGSAERSGARQSASALTLEDPDGAVGIAELAVARPAILSVMQAVAVLLDPSP